MERILILTIRSKGGGAEKIIEKLVNSRKDKFIWVNMELFLDFSFFIRYLKFFLLIYKNITKVDKVIIGTEGILGLVVFPFKCLFKKKFILWNHCYFDDYKRFLSKRNKILYSISYSMYPLKINASPASRTGVFIPNPYIFNNVSLSNNFTTNSNICLLSVSSLAKLKSVDLSIKLLSKLPLNYTLNIYGDGVERENLINLVDEFNLQRRVRFLGFTKTPFSDDIDVSRLLIINSQTEALPTIILEAIEHSIPVVVKRYKGAEYWDKFNTVFIFDEITSEETLNIIDYLKSISNSEYRDLFSRDLQCLKDRHDYFKFVNSLETI